MRDIEFRCWSYNSNTMQDWGELKKHGDFYRLLYMSDKYPMMQYTGLKDKNGVKIFEGDILDLDPPYFLPAKVVYCDSDAAFKFEYTDDSADHLSDYYPDELEIIGNIHENQELLS